MNARFTAADLASTIYRKIREKYNALEPQTCNGRVTSVTSDDLSRAMLPFLREINKLRQLPDADSLTLAYKLVLDVAAYSYGDLDGGCGYGSRPSDILADALLVRVAKARRN